MANSDIHQIIKQDSWQLYVSNFATAKNIELLDHLEIKTVISIGHSYGKTTHFFDFDDDENTNIIRQFLHIYPIINAAKLSNSNVLIHCHAGKSRSISIILAYLMVEHQATLKSALQYVKKIRPHACPIDTFLCQLYKFGQLI